MSAKESFNGVDRTCSTITVTARTSTSQGRASASAVLTTGPVSLAPIKAAWSKAQAAIVSTQIMPRPRR